MSDVEPWKKLYPPSVASFRLEGPLTAARLLDEAVTRHGDRTALTFGAQTMSFVDVDRHARAFAAMLAHEGLRPGDRVAICLPNRPEYVVTLLGSMLAGMQAVQVNYRYPAIEIDKLLQDCEPSFVVALRETAEKCGTGADGFLGYRFLEVTRPGQDGFADVSSSDRVLPFERFRQFLDVPIPDVPDAQQSVGVLQYTGGTTGMPKGVELTQGNLVANVLARSALTYDLMDIPEGAVSINVLPMGHAYGLTSVTLVGLRCGLNQILFETFDAGKILATIRERTPYVFTGVPTMYLDLLRQPDIETSGLEKVTIFNAGGSGFPLEHIQRFEALTGGRIVEGYGMSEASPTTHINPSFVERRIGSVGIPLPLTEARIIDMELGVSADELTPLPANTVGELLIRGPQVMRGYRGRPAETAAALRDGWLFTGDLAHYDEDGFFYIDGRKKEMVVSGGFNVYPAEVERVLTEYPGVIEAAAVGLPDDFRGEVLAAFVVTEPRVPAITAEDLEEHCRRNLAAYKVPVTLRLVGDLPRTAVGKINKRSLVTDAAS